MVEKNNKWENGSRGMEKQLQNDEVRLSTCKSTQALCKGRVYKSLSWLSESREKVGHYFLLFEGSRLDENDS